MTVDPRQLRSITTAAEFALVRASSPAEIRKLSAPALKANISRTRRLRDKHRDLLRRQRLRSRARTGTKDGGNARTAQKAQIFEKTLARFERRLDTMKATATSKPRKSGKTALRQKARTPRMKAMQAHIGSRGRRRQARRDSR